MKIILEVNASALGWPVMTVSYVSSTSYLWQYKNTLDLLLSFTKIDNGLG